MPAKIRRATTGQHKPSTDLGGYGLSVTEGGVAPTNHRDLRCMSVNKIKARKEKTMKNKSIVTVMILLILTTAAYSATYYVDGNLTADCDGTNYHYDVATRTRIAGPGQIAWQKVSSANSVLVAGDTVYIRGGVSDYQVYNIGRYESDRDGIRPLHSGTDASNRITYATYQNEKVNFIGDDTVRVRGAFITDKNWIKITGYDGSTSAMNMKFSNMTEFLFIWSATSSGGAGSNYNEVSYCEFEKTNQWGITNEAYRGTTIYRNSSFNWIHNCLVHDYGYYTENDGGSALEIGNVDCGQSSDCLDSTSNNVIENCAFYHGGHNTIGLHHHNNVIRNNIFHNEQWYYYTVDQVWHGYRNFYMSGADPALSGYAANHGYNLIENNRISHASENVNNSKGGTGITMPQSNNIIRYNDLYANAGFAISFSIHINTSAKFNHIYNNTFFANGWGATFPDIAIPPHRDTHDRRPIYVPCGYPDGKDWNLFSNIVFKNNLFWKNWGYADGLDMIISNNRTWDFSGCPGHAVCADIVFDHNYNATGAEVNPKFVSEGSYSSPVVNSTDVEWYWYSPSTPDGSDITTHNTEPDFNLQSQSPAIDGGNYLTQANGSASNSTTLIVDDAKYFQPGWGNGAGGGASVQADCIAIGKVSNTAQISSINYDTKTITLASPMTWSTGAPVWLYKNSSGQVVLRGSAPDCGAHEYVPTQLQTWSLIAGWNWISFNVLPADLSLNSVFSTILTQVEQVKAQTQSAIRSSGAWKGDLVDMNGIGQYKMYKVKATQVCTLTVTGTAVPSATPIQLAGSWNWVAFLPTMAMPIANALDSIKGQVLQIKSLNQSATFNGTSWSGTLTQLEPGQGYAIKMNGPGTLIYPDVGAYNHTSISRKE
jgi:hypothetical protein